MEREIDGTLEQKVLVKMNRYKKINDLVHVLLKYGFELDLELDPIFIQPLICLQPLTKKQFESAPPLPSKPYRMQFSPDVIKRQDLEIRKQALNFKKMVEKTRLLITI